jgi:serine/threonine protein kinase
MIINKRTAEGYGKAVDWWALGCMIYEMLIGWPPYYDTNPERQSAMILRATLTFHDDEVKVEENAKSLIAALLDRDPSQRLGSAADGGAQVKASAFFGGMEWHELVRRKLEPPFRPNVNGEDDVQVGNRCSYRYLLPPYTAATIILLPPFSTGGLA